MQVKCSLFNHWRLCFTWLPCYRRRVRRNVVRLSNKLSKNKSKKGICVYCGTYSRITKDHIPPKNLFGQPRPSNLITVPCCDTCNISFSKDDEYFRFSISIRDDIFEDVQNIYSKVMRSLHKPNKVGFRNNFLRTVKSI